MSAHYFSLDGEKGIGRRFEPELQHNDGTQRESSGATIIGGVTVGENSVVAAGSAIRGRSPEYPCWRKSGESYSFDWQVSECPQGVETSPSN